jgi:hypothetical protein
MEWAGCSSTGSVTLADTITVAIILIWPELTHSTRLRLPTCLLLILQVIVPLASTIATIATVARAKAAHFTK